MKQMFKNFNVIIICLILMFAFILLLIRCQSPSERNLMQKEINFAWDYIDVLENQINDTSITNRLYLEIEKDYLD